MMTLETINVWRMDVNLLEGITGKCMCDSIEVMHAFCTCAKRRIKIRYRWPTTFLTTAKFLTNLLYFQLRLLLTVGLVILQNIFSWHFEYHRRDILGCLMPIDYRMSNYWQKVLVINRLHVSVFKRFHCNLDHYVRLGVILTVGQSVWYKLALSKRFRFFRRSTSHPSHIHSSKSTSQYYLLGRLAFKVLY